MSPVIGITPDITEPKPGVLRVQVSALYGDAVRRAGGMPIILQPNIELIPDQLALCHGFVFTGGDDPKTEPFGEPTHPQTTPVHPQRQAYETALLAAINARGQDSPPLLGICLGMQMMALTAGGRLNQHLPDTHASAADHAKDARHTIVPAIPALASGRVTSHHHQAVADPGRLRAAAHAHDGVIEAIDDPARPFHLGVQWHPERTEDERLGLDLFKRLVASCRESPERKLGV